MDLDPEWKHLEINVCSLDMFSEISKSMKNRYKSLHKPFGKRRSAASSSTTSTGFKPDIFDHDLLD